MIATLKTAKLSHIKYNHTISVYHVIINIISIIILHVLYFMFLFFSSDFDCQSLFLLPSHVLYKTVTLLISGAAIDRDENKVIHLLIIIIIIIIIYYYYLLGGWSLSTVVSGATIIN